jgi:hypothetical protein
MCISIHDSSTVFNGRQVWHPLEAWLNMVRIGKMKAVSEDDNDHLHKFDPWVLVPYSEAMLEETVAAFNKLVQAIESRLPKAPEATVADQGLVEENILDAANVPQGFARDFVGRVQRPRFRYIAPGLEIPNSSTILQQPFFSLPRDEGDEAPPILLFRSQDHYTAPQDADVTGLDLPFSWPCSQIQRYLAGLYLESTDPAANNRFDDGCKLVLPFGIGVRGYARTSDRALFGENTESEDAVAKDTFADLYQPGHQPFIEMHSVRLVDVLKNWLAMVERGDWKVDEDGVVGGIDEWKKADTGSDWEKYVIPLTW